MICIYKNRYTIWVVIGLEKYIKKIENYGYRSCVFCVYKVKSEKLLDFE